jgi:hypothetical protein
MTNAPQLPQTPGVSFAPAAGGAPGTAIGAPTPAPIHDIVGPIPFFTTPVGMIVLLLILALAVGFYWWFRGRKKTKPITPREAAMDALGKMRSRIGEGNDHDFGVGVSDVLRRFLGEALGLAAPRQTTEEFLISLQGSLRFVPAEQAALAEFLHQSDYLKYAQGEATSEQRIALIEAAESFVKSGEVSPEATPAGEPQDPQPPAFPEKPSQAKGAA